MPRESNGAWRSASGRSRTARTNGKRPPNSLRSHGQSTFVSVLSRPTMPIDSSVATTKIRCRSTQRAQARVEQGRRPEGECHERHDRADQPAAAGDGRTRSPTSCRADPSSRARHRRTGASDLDRRASVSRRQTPARRIPRAAPRRWDHQKRTEGTAHQNDAGFRSAAARCRCRCARSSGNGEIDVQHVAEPGARAAQAQAEPDVLEPARRRGAAKSSWPQVRPASKNTAAPTLNSFSGCQSV